MRRSFTLREIGFDEYNILCGQFDIPPRNSPGLQRNGETAESRRYFVTDTRVAYPGVGEIIADMSDDDFQSLNAVWMPGDQSLRKASWYTRNKPDEYYSELIGKSGDYYQLVVRIGTPHSYRDWFQFHKDGDIWLLRNIRINQRNFRFYKFEGADIDNSIHAISAIYTGN